MSEKSLKDKIGPLTLALKAINNLVKAQIELKEENKDLRNTIKWADKTISALNHDKKTLEKANSYYKKLLKDRSEKE